MSMTPISHTTPSRLVIITPVDDFVIARDLHPEVAALLVDAYVKKFDLHDVDAHFVDDVNGDTYTYDFADHTWLVL